MSDRRAVSAGHRVPDFQGASSVAANETWRVAVGGNRVESMTVDQIAHAFHSGHLNVRTPLWPPGTTGWQALGNFEQFNQFQQPAGYGGGALSQFEEADDDPTRMWTGGSEMDLAGMEAAMGVGQAAEPEARPSARTGVRQVAPSRGPAPAPSRPVPMAPPPQHMSVPARPAPTASLPPSRSPSVVPASIPPFRKSRGNGLMLVAGLVGLVGLGSAVLAARGSWGNASDANASQPAEPAPSAEVAPTAEPPAPITADPAPAEPKLAQPEAPKPAPSAEQGEARLAKYEDSSAFVAGEAKPAAAPEPSAAEAPAKSTESPRVAAKEQDGENTSHASARADRTAKSKLKSEDATPKRASARETPKRSAAVASTRAKAPPAPEVRVEKAEKPEKAAKVEKVEKAEAAEAPQAPANAAVNEAAATALANSATLAASCRPPGGPSGQGKARVIYSNDGEVQSVEILTAKFRDTLTGSCVRMVFRRAKISPFKGEPPTFIKSFTIPES
jgi:hypothetical protein